MNSLRAKLSITLIVLIFILGGIFYSLDRQNVKQYHEELSQRLNASIAMYIVDSMPLIDNGTVQEETLNNLAQTAMVVNPSAEIYLLDSQGNILNHGQNPDDVLRTRVDIAPLKSLLSGDATFPIRADDPRHLKQQKIFSAHPIIDKSSQDSSVAGYLYVVLGGAQYDALAKQVGSGYWQKMMLSTSILLTLISVAIGVLLFGLITGRLRKLTAQVNRFAQVDLHTPTKVITNFSDNSKDEIGQLNNSFHVMSNKIVEQFNHLEENDKLRRELITNISHDLRTPLASMQGYIETLLLKGENIEPELRAKYLNIARKHTVHLNRLIADLFELSKLDSGRVAPSKEEFPLLELVHDVVQEFQLEAKKRKINIKLELDNQNTTVIADIGLIQRVLENLIKNALRFTPANGTITIGVSEKNSTASITVADTGFGIQTKDLPRVFDRFYRSKDGEESKADSTGLGLAIVKRILDLHETSIHVTSKVHQGTSFVFDLPTDRLAA